MPVSNSKIVINLPSHTLFLYADNTLVSKYPVGTGRSGFPTPIGTYTVIDKIKNPGWENPLLPSHKQHIKPGAQNPLGTRWLGFKQWQGGEYGIHGTNQPGSIGKSVTHGCIRMKTSDVEALFDHVGIGVPVEVTDQ